MTCIIGDLPHERTTPQEIVLSLFLTLDLSAVAQSDALEDTVDYVRASQLVTHVAQSGQFRLIETLAVRIAQTLREHFPQILKARVLLNKLGTIPMAHGAQVDITL